MYASMDIMTRAGEERLIAIANTAMDAPMAHAPEIKTLLLPKLSTTHMKMITPRSLKPPIAEDMSMA